MLNSPPLKKSVWWGGGERCIFAGFILVWVIMKVCPCILATKLIIPIYLKCAYSFWKEIRLHLIGQKIHCKNIFANNNLFKWNKIETIYRIKETIHLLWTLYTHNILIVHKQITGLSTHSHERQPKYTFKVEPIFFS